MKRRACVLDTYLALSTYGLLLAQRLSSELDLWLVRELWHILDNTEFELKNVSSLEPSRHGGADISGTALKESLRQWDLARTETDLAGLKCYWVGDALRESLFPPGVDQQLVHRFETLARSLDRRARGKFRERGHDIAAECFRDTAALSVALTPYRSFILTHLWPGETRSPQPEPLICSYLKEWDIPCYPITCERKTEFEREFIRPILARCGVSELMWAGLNLAAVHLLVPHAVVIPDPQRDESSYPEDLQSMPETEHDAKDWWESALGFWYPVGCE